MSAREAILDAALDVLAREQGPLRPEAVARRTGVSKALVFHHFGTREGLLDAMAARVLSETQAGLDRLALDYPNPRDRLEALARTLLEDPRETPPVEARRVLMFWMEGDPCRAAPRDALLADFIAATVREGSALGTIRAGVDARAAADLLLARWHGAAALFATGRAPDLEREAERTVEELARMAFR